MNIIALQGSVRPGNNTAKALSVVAGVFSTMDDVNFEIIDPTKMDLRLPGRGSSDHAKYMQQKVADAAAVILATPEYHGSFSSVMKLLIDNLGFPSVLKGKPVALLGVAAGSIGAIKALEHLRSVASHVGAIVLPGPVSIAGVRTAFDETGVLVDKNLNALIYMLAEGLVEYVKVHTCPMKELEAVVRDG